MSTTITEPITCKKCGKGLDAHTGEGDHSPTEGSISICIRCANVAIYTKDMKLRELTEEDKKSIKEQPEVLEKIKSVITFILSDSNPLRNKND